MLAANTQSDDEMIPNLQLLNVDNDEIIGDHVNEGTKITDVNIDCLAHIFKYLNLQNLVNVSDTNKQLKEAADMIFNSKLRMKMVYLGSKFKQKKFYALQQSHEWFRFEHGRIEPYHPASSLKLIRCFGHLITKMVIFNQFIENKAFISELNHYISEYCTESLIDMEIYEMTEETLMDLQKPFTKLESLHFHNAQLNDKLLTLNKWFPNISKLKIGLISTVYSLEISTEFLYFPHLIHLSICNGKFPMNILLDILCSNKQLQSLKLFDTVTPLLLHIISDQHHLERLTFSTNYNTFSYDSIHLKLKAVKKFSITYDSIQPIPVIPFKFDALEELTIDLDGFPVNDRFLEFIRKQSTLVKLTVLSSREITDENKLKFALPWLHEIRLNYSKFSIDEVITFLDKCKLINNFKFWLSEQSDFSELRTRLATEWKSSIYFRRRVQLKRIKN